ncbi:beta-lactamase family protein [Kineosporia rhizophila]|uniref:serine hydrolase domain-containing protein n=1 Tax=Kineosporia rhizophila TaxID=84633 RepID=UPI001E6168B1|nr:serine hydrolase domain-containing protein [Kineosporia rhizophila]MCE0537990.1 beta-lactamase family protein [Kineosporia rhizophila]
MTNSKYFGRSAVTAFGLAAVLVTTTLAGATAQAAGADRPKNDLQRTADAVVEAGAVGYLVRVNDGQHVRTATAGLADLNTQRRMRNKDQYEAGSQTKTFVSVLTLQLVAQGKVKLDAPVEQYLPGVVPDGRNITVRMLLQHTSGLFNYTEHENFFPGIVTEPSRVIAPPEILKTAFGHEPYFAPGQGWHYSNTNYVVIGEMLHELTGRSVKDLIQQRIAKPLKLRDTYLADPFAEATGPGFAHGYALEIADGEFTYTDTSDWSLSWGGAAGAVISTSRDLSAFYAALLSGKLLPAAQLAEMKKTVPMDEQGFYRYGLGLFSQKTSCGTAWGHDGGTLGHNSITLVSPDGKRTVSSDVNISLIMVTDKNDPALEASAQAYGEAQITAVCAMFGKKVPSASYADAAGLNVLR